MYHICFVYSFYSFQHSQLRPTSKDSQFHGDLLTLPMDSVASSWLSLWHATSHSHTTWAPSHFLRILQTLPMLTGLLRVDPTKSGKWAWRRGAPPTLPGAWPRSNASWRRDHLVGADGGLLDAHAMASISSGSSAQGLASARAPRGMWRTLARWSTSVNRADISWAVCRGSTYLLEGSLAFRPGTPPSPPSGTPSGTCGCGGGGGMAR